MLLRNNPMKQECVKKITIILLQNWVTNATPRKHIRFMHNYKKSGGIRHAVFTRYNVISTLQVTP